MLCAGAFDFLGVNYYTRHAGRAPRRQPSVRLLDRGTAASERKKTAMGWEVYPEGSAAEIATRFERTTPSFPSTSPRTARAFDDQASPEGQVEDGDRIEYLEEHLGRCLEAIQKGVDLRGYFVWSILDNFEWAEGYRKRFGLVRVELRDVRAHAQGVVPVVRQGGGDAGARRLGARPSGRGRAAATLLLR